MCYDARSHSRNSQGSADIKGQSGNDQKALPPLADGLVGHSERARHHRIGLPAAHSNTIRERCASACALLGRRAQHSTVSCSSAARLKGAIGLPVRIRVLYPFLLEADACGLQFIRLIDDSGH